MKSRNPVRRKLLLGWVFLHEFILLQISLHCLAAHFLIECIKILSVG